MKTKDIVRFIYWEGVPLIIGFILFRYTGIDGTDSFWDILKVFFSNLYIIIPIIIIHIWIGNRIFKDIDTSTNKLASKMMRCKLRKKNGFSYCAKCPDGYTCAGDIKR